MTNPIPTGNYPELSGDREILFTRIVNAPRELVFKVWTEPEHVLQWWGPTGFTTTNYEMEVKPGGIWRFCMHGPDGRDYQNIITYREVVPPERLVYEHGGDKECEPVNFQVRITFEPHGGGRRQTKLTMRMTFPSSNAREYVVKTYGAIEGGRQHLARLEEHLAKVPV